MCVLQFCVFRAVCKVIFPQIPWLCANKNSREPNALNLWIPGCLTHLWFLWAKRFPSRPRANVRRQTRLNPKTKIKHFQRCMFSDFCKMRGRFLLICNRARKLDTALDVLSKNSNVIERTIRIVYKKIYVIALWVDVPLFSVFKR